MKKYKPTTAGRRGMSGISYRDELTATSPHKALTKGRKRGVGRSKGRISSRHRGGGHKRRWREIDFRYDKIGVPARVETIEYDPNYILAPQSVKVGDTLLVAEDAPLTPGNRVPVAKVPIGSFVYNIEIKPGGGAKLVRSAGSYAEVIAHDSGYVHLKMPSTEVRKVRDTVWVSLGEVSNPGHKLVNLGKAGRSRWLGKRPTVRGSAMNPVDHPHGGGEGRGGRGHRRARTAQGRPTGKGQKTRKTKKYSNTFIVSRRKVGKKRKK